MTRLVLLLALVALYFVSINGCAALGQHTTQVANAPAQQASQETGGLINKTIGALTLDTDVWTQRLLVAGMVLVALFAPSPLRWFKSNTPATPAGPAVPLVLVVSPGASPYAPLASPVVYSAGGTTPTGHDCKSVQRSHLTSPN